MSVFSYKYYLVVLVWHKKEMYHAARAGVDNFRANFFYRFKIMIQNQTTEVLYHQPQTIN